MTSRPLPRYLAALAGFGALFPSVVFVLCLAIDPLWYFGGNRLTNFNIPFNESIQVAHRFFRNGHRYDCIVFGSSRTALVDISAIEGHRCLSMAFAGAYFDSKVALARYVSQFRSDFALVVVGVDDFDLGPTPSFATGVKTLWGTTDRPPPWWTTYPSIDALRMSYRAFTHSQRSFGYAFDDAFRPIRFKRPPYLPASPVEPDRTPLVSRRIDFAQLRQFFPRARLVGYGTMTSPWISARRLFGGTLDGFLHANWETAQAFDAFFDFNFPAGELSAAAFTNDGAHYVPLANRVITDAINGRPPAPIPDLRRIDLAQYQHSFHAALAEFVRTHKIAGPSQ